MSGPNTEASGVVGARRLLTVMFCDLVGSTSISQRLDPEDYADVVLEYQETGRRVVEQHGGIVAQFVGDGLVIQFGYPVAHENDAERAVQTAFALLSAVAEMSGVAQHAHGIELRCRIGIHADVTVVGRMGEGRNDMSLFGTTANVAARVQAEAEPGEVIVTNAFLELLRGDYAVDGRRDVVLRGIDGPVGISRIVGRATAIRRRGPELIVGRDDERASLARHWEAARERRGGAVVIVGPPGIGKSTVIDGLRRMVDVAVYIEVRARELAILTPFAQLVELAQQLTLVNIEALSEAARSVCETVSATPDGVGGSAENHWHLVVEAAHTLGRVIGAHRCIVVLEDLHWLDASSRSALEALAGELVDSQSLLVMTSRPPAVFDSARIIEIDRLSDVDIASLVRAAAATDIDDDTVNLIVRRAAGVPLYAEELARTVGSTAALPDSLQASLLARLDRSAELARPAQIASVLGDEIDPVLLGAVLDADADQVADLLDNMEAAGLVHRLPSRHVTFAHALLREAVYGSLLQRDRRQIHRRAAVSLDGDGARDDDRLTLVAHHWEHANEQTEAAQCFGLAARRTARRGAFAEAIALAARGSALVSGLVDRPDIALDLLMTAGNARLTVEGYAAEGINELWHAAEGLAIAAGNRQELSSAMNGPSVAALFAGDYALAISQAERVRRFGEQHADRSALIRGHCSLAIPQLFAGDVAASLDNARSAIELYQPGDDQLLTYGFGTDHGVIAYSTAGMAAWFADDADSDRMLVAAIEHAERIESPISLCLALQQAASVDLAAQRYDVACDRSRRVEEVATRFGLPFYVALGRLARAAAEAWHGNPGALGDANDALGVLLTGTSALGPTLGLFQLAICQEGVGQTADAAATARYGVSLACSSGEFMLHVELAQVVARCSHLPEAWDELARAADAADERGAAGSARRARQAIADLALGSA